MEALQSPHDIPGHDEYHITHHLGGDCLKIYAQTASFWRPWSKGWQGKDINMAKNPQAPLRRILIERPFAASQTVYDIPNCNWLTRESNVAGKRLSHRRAWAAAVPCHFTAQMLSAHAAQSTWRLEFSLSTYRPDRPPSLRALCSTQSLTLHTVRSTMYQLSYIKIRGACCAPHGNFALRKRTRLSSCINTQGLGFNPPIDTECESVESFLVGRGA